MNFLNAKQLTEADIKDTTAFLDYSQALSQITFDDSVLEDSRFTVLRSFSTPVSESTKGRANPFAVPDQGMSSITR
jgi:hypothetical protein